MKTLYFVIHPVRNLIAKIRKSKSGIYINGVFIGFILTAFGIISNSNCTIKTSEQNLYKKVIIDDDLPGKTGTPTGGTGTATTSTGTTSGTASGAGTGTGTGTGSGSGTGSGTGSGVWNPPFEGHHSYWTLTTSNGLSVSTYTLIDYSDTRQNKLDRFKDHIYSNYDDSTPSKDFLYDLYFGFRKNGDSDSSSWLNTTDPQSAEYINGTGIIKTVQLVGGVFFESYYFIPFHAPGGGENESRFLVALVKITNDGFDANDCSLFALLNFHMGGCDNTGAPDYCADGETISYNGTDDYLMESKGDVKFIYKSLIPQDYYGADIGGGPNNPWEMLSGGSHLTNSVVSGDDVAAGMENQVNSGDDFLYGETYWFGMIIGFADSASITETDLWTSINSFINSRDPETILNDEIAWWDNWHTGESMPSGIFAEEEAVYRQSTAVLKMGQSRETSSNTPSCITNKCYGQVLASLVPGQWNISWVRDGSYAIMGLVRSNHLNEAKSALEFMLNADMLDEPFDDNNDYQVDYIENSNTAAPWWGLGVNLDQNYAISVVRHYGNGTEESDVNANGPNIEWDDWGLFLWALGEYEQAVEQSGGTSLITDITYWEKASLRTADLLIQLLDPAVNQEILYPDSSIWERHWNPAGSGVEVRRHFTYSNICAYKGLKMAAYMAGLKGDPSKETLYNTNADIIRQGIIDNLIIASAQGTGQPVIAGNLEEMAYVDPPYYMDQSVVEAINVGVITPDSSEAAGTIAAFDHYLSMESHSPGYFRTDDEDSPGVPNWYDRQEWVVVDLRTASALVKMNEMAKAKTILDWITDQARNNYNLIGELLSDGVYQPGSEDDRWDANNDNGGDYQGAIPMCGFGPGAYILGINDYYSSN
jgi:GH15 family glucan-1,4-alpha-glucosidase